MAAGDEEEIAVEMVEDDGAVVRRGPGRPKLDNPKDLVSIRIDHDMLAAFRLTGRGWRTLANVLLRAVMTETGRLIDHQVPKPWRERVQLARQILATHGGRDANAPNAAGQGESLTNATLIETLAALRNIK